MLVVKVGNSLSEVVVPPLKLLGALREACSYQVSTGRRVQRRKKNGKIVWVKETYKYHLMNKAGEFPTGLLYLIVEELKTRKIPYTLLDKRINPPLNSIELRAPALGEGRKPYPEQLEASNEVLRHRRGIISAPTGTGKSLIIALICKTLCVKTLIVVPTLELKRQLTESLNEWFGEGVAGPIGKRSRPTALISVENVDALDPEVKLEGIDCLIIDEFHHSAAATYRELNLKSWDNIYYRVGLTATPFRSNSDERLLLESVLSKVIYRIDYQTAVSKGYIVPLEVYYIDLPRVKKSMAGLETYHSAYADYIVNNDLRNKAIADIVSNLISSNSPTLILTKQIVHGEILQKLIEERGFKVHFAEGTNEFKGEYIKSFNNLEATALIGTVGVLGEGIDTRPTEWVVLAGGGKSKNQFFQNIGRGFRNFSGKTSCKILMFRDPNNKWMLDHFNQCIKYLKEDFGIMSTRLDLP